MMADAATVHFMQELDAAHRAVPFQFLGLHEVPYGSGEHVLVACNFTPVVCHDHRVGTPRAGAYREVLNTDSALYGGSNTGNLGRRQATATPSHGREHSVALTLPPLAAVYLVPEA